MRLFAVRLLIMVFFTAPVARAEEPLPIIRWAKNHAPPFFIDDGSVAGAGFADGVQAMLMQALPQYDHQNIFMPLPRLNDFWKKKAEYCFASMIHKPLAADRGYLLSQPNVYYAPHVVITRQSFAPADEDASAVSLQQLLRQKHLILGQIRPRAFGPTVDALLAQHKDTLRSFVRNDRDGVQSLLRMLILERIDYFIDYAFVFEFYRKQASFEQHLQSFTIKETADEGILGAIGCTNSTWGKRVIADIDQALDQLLQSRQYRQFVARWQAIDVDDQQYWQAFNKQINRLEDTSIRPSP